MVKKSSLALLRTVTIVAIGGALALPPAPAAGQSPDPCSAIVCLGGMVAGQDGGPACSPSIDAFFGIVVFDPYYDAGATANLRSNWLNSCPAPADAQVVAAIIATYGTTP